MKTTIKVRGKDPDQAERKQNPLAQKGGTTLKKQLCVASVAMLLVALFTVSAFATDAQIYFATDMNGQNRVTNIQEGDTVYIVVIDNDKNIDCDLRDKVWADIKVMDPKTGAYIVWNQHVSGDLGVNLHLNNSSFVAAGVDYLEETGADTGVFVSKRSFRIGTRESYAAATPHLHTHVVDQVVNAATTDFQWGHYLFVDPANAANGYADQNSHLIPGPTFLPSLMNPAQTTVRPPSAWREIGLTTEYIIGRFENNDTLIGCTRIRGTAAMWRRRWRRSSTPPPPSPGIARSTRTAA